MDDRGLNDAAILLVSLGEEEAAEVFKHLTPKEVQKLGETIARMRGVTREKVDFVIDRFTSDAASQSLLVDDASDYVRSVLKRARFFQTKIPFLSFYYLFVYKSSDLS